MKVAIGDYMYVTDDNLEGKVVGVKEGQVTLLCNDGFEYDFFIHQVFKKVENNQVQHKSSSDLIKSALATETKSYPKIGIVPRVVEVKLGQVFDLHIEELAPHLHFDNAHETLTFQLNYVRNVIYSASQKRVRRIVFVHGIGSGKLRRELRKMIDEEFASMEYFDGDYKKFGQGATEICIHQFF